MTRLAHGKGRILGRLTILIGLSVSCTQQPWLPARTPPPLEEQPARIELQEFVLGPQDEVEVFVWHHADLSRTAVVSPAGFLSYPLVGTIKVTGLTGDAVAAQIHEGLVKYIVDPQVTVTVKSVRSQKIFVLGEVNRPGVFPLDGPVRAVEAIARSGGFNQDAQTKSVLLIRGDLSRPELYTLALDRTLFRGAPGENVRLQPGDIIYVPATTVADMERFAKRITAILIPLIAPIQTAIFTVR